MTRKKVCILVRNDLERDPRVRRQVAWLAASGQFELTVVGFGKPGWKMPGADRTICLNRPEKTIARQLYTAIRLLACNLSGEQSEGVYWSNSIAREMYAAIAGERFDIIHANDWDTLPIAVRSAGGQAKVVYDSHELAVAEFDGEWWFSLFHRAYREYIEKKYIKEAGIVITVSRGIARELQSIYGVQEPAVIMNCPDWQEHIANAVNGNEIKLCHHGKYGRDRGIDELINAVGLLGINYSLHLFLVAEKREIARLEELAIRKAPQRVFFHQPVPPENITATINCYDIGIYGIQPSNLNNAAALPNKFFEFIMAGLCLCIGPVPEMKEQIELFNCGVVANGFDAKSMAEKVASLTVEEIMDYKKRSLQAAHFLNSATEGKKFLEIYQRL